MNLDGKKNGMDMIFLCLKHIKKSGMNDFGKKIQ